MNIMFNKGERALNRIPDAILKHRRIVLFVFLGAALAGLFLSTLVDINYNLSDYLPADAPSTAALEKLESSFSQDVPNIRIYIKDVAIPEALDYKARIASVSGVEQVLWLDDVVDVYRPLAMADPDTVEAWYKDGGALISASIDTAQAAESVAKLREVVGDRGVLSGEAVNLAAAQGTVANEIPKIMLFVVPLVLIILIFSTSSWFEPVLFLITIGIAILVNEGTNIFLGQISFVTRATSAVLQLAVSMDYAVFLLHAFARFRHEGVGLHEAMSKAMKQSFSAIAASAATTVLGFLVLALMRFKIGPDMGVVLAKGVLISFVSVTVLLPVLALSTARLMDKTHHRPLLPSFEKFGRFVVRICVPLGVVIVLLIVPSFLAQKSNTFIYGSSGMQSEGSQIKKDAQEINAKFGESVQMVLLVPEGDEADETALGDALGELGDVTSVVSYANTVGVQIPSGFLPKEQAEVFRSGGYSRLILYVSTPDEGDSAFRAVEAVRETAHEYVRDGYYLTGQSVVNYDLKQTITGDNPIVTIAAVIAIGVVLLLTFRSLSIPLLLLLTIEGAIWLNLSIPYFAGDTLNYIGYQIISAVQLGATVDYGILFSQHYMRNRERYGKREAARKAVAGTAASILTPACILAIAGLTLGFVSSNGIISQLGAILGRGAVISAAMVLLFLPGLLTAFDKVIQKTTLKTFRKRKELKP